MTALFGARSLSELLSSSSSSDSLLVWRCFFSCFVSWQLGHPSLHHHSHSNEKTATYFLLWSRTQHPTPRKAPCPQVFAAPMIPKSWIAIAIDIQGWQKGNQLTIFFSKYFRMTVCYIVTIWMQCHTNVHWCWRWRTKSEKWYLTSNRFLQFNFTFLVKNCWNMFWSHSAT